MKAVLSFTIPTTFPGMNEIIDMARDHWSKSAEQKKTWTETAYYSISKRGYLVKPPYTIEFRWYEKNAKRDLDNIMAAQKFILDALVKRGVFPNDGQRNIQGLRHSVFVSKENPRVEVDIYEGVC